LTIETRAEEPRIGFILHPAYRVRSGRAVVQLFGRLQDGPPFLVEDTRERPYFFVRAEDAPRVSTGAAEIAATGLSDLAGNPAEEGSPSVASPFRAVVFVTDGLPFVGRDVLNIRLGHLGTGTARVVSDAVIVHCIGKMRMDGGPGSPSYRDEIGLVRDGMPLPVLSNVWRQSPYARRRPVDAE